MDNLKVLQPGTYNSKVNESANCSNLEAYSGGRDFGVHDLTRLNDDKCYQTETTEQSVSASDYMLTNFRSCDKDFSNVLSRSTENQGIVISDGYGVASRGVPESSKLRVGEYKSRPKHTQQLFTRPYLGVPYMGRGSGNVCVESTLLSSQVTNRDHTVSTEENQQRTLDNSLVPLVKNLSDNVQNPSNLVEERVNPKWVRGGVPSRQIVKDLDYFARSSDKQEHKDYIMGKKAYMHHCLKDN